MEFRIARGIKFDTFKIPVNGLTHYLLRSEPKVAHGGGNSYRKFVSVHRTRDHGKMIDHVLFDSKNIIWPYVDNLTHSYFDDGDFNEIKALSAFKRKNRNR